LGRAHALAARGSPTPTTHGDRRTDRSKAGGLNKSQGPSLDLTKTELGPTIGRAPNRQTRSIKLSYAVRGTGPAWPIPGGLLIGSWEGLSLDLAKAQLGPTTGRAPTRDRLSQTSKQSYDRGWARATEGVRIA
jgi:hypothetical protein